MPTNTALAIAVAIILAFCVGAFWLLNWHARLNRKTKGEDDGE